MNGDKKNPFDGIIDAEVTQDLVALWIAQKRLLGSISFNATNDDHLRTAATVFSAAYLAEPGDVDMLQRIAPDTIAMLADHDVRHRAWDLILADAKAAGIMTDDDIKGGEAEALYERMYLAVAQVLKAEETKDGSGAD